MADKPIYTKSNQELDIERRQADDYQPLGVVVQGEVPPLSDDGFVGVSPEYRNYANETEKPGVATEGVYADLDSQQLADGYDVDKGATPETNVEASDEDEDDDEEDDDKKSGVGVTSFTPPNPS